MQTLLVVNGEVFVAAFAFKYGAFVTADNEYFAEKFERDEAIFRVI